jgi:hypothetical protein
MDDPGDAASPFYPLIRVRPSSVTSDAIFSLIPSCRWEEWAAVEPDAAFAAMRAPPKAEQGGGIDSSRFECTPSGPRCREVDLLLGKG